MTATHHDAYPRASRGQLRAPGRRRRTGVRGRRGTSHPAAIQVSTACCPLRRITNSWIEIIQASKVQASRCWRGSGPCPLASVARTLRSGWPLRQDTLRVTYSSPWLLRRGAPCPERSTVPVLLLWDRRVRSRRRAHRAGSSTASGRLIGSSTRMSCPLRVKNLCG